MYEASSQLMPRLVVDTTIRKTYKQPNIDRRSHSQPSVTSLPQVLASVSSSISCKWSMTDEVSIVLERCKVVRWEEKAGREVEDNVWHDTWLASTSSIPSKWLARHKNCESFFLSNTISPTSPNIPKEQSQSGLFLLNPFPFSVFQQLAQNLDMPLTTTNLSPADLESALKASQHTSRKPRYVIFYASLTDGRSWCGDCRDAEPFVSKQFGGWSEDVLVVYAGLREE